MEIAIKESILSLLNSTDSDDVKLGIIFLLREAKDQEEVVNIAREKPVNTEEFSYWKCKDKWLFINKSYIIASTCRNSPQTFTYTPYSDTPVIHDVYDPE